MRFPQVRGPSYIAGLMFVWTATHGAVTLVSQESDVQLEINSLVNRESESLFQLYRHLHSNPELSFHEIKTAERMRKELENTGFQVTAAVGGHGLVGVLKNGEGPTIMVRTDLDGLPVTEETGLEYASRVRVKDDLGKDVGVMHACGHDVHMTCFIGAARLLSQMKHRWKGTLVMIGQPAEERGGGAKAMLEDGLFQRFPRPNYVLAMHDAADIEAGKVGICEGYALAGTGSIDLTIRGISGHGAYSYTTKDPIVLAAQTILALQTIVSREVRAIDPAVVTVGSVHGGSKHNIIPDEVRLQLTIRYYSDEVKARILESIERISKGMAEAAGIPVERTPTMKVVESVAPTYNDPALARRTLKAIEAILGQGNVLTKEPVMGGEDFGYFGRTPEKIPICIFWVGTVSPQKFKESQTPGGASLPSLHSSIFAPEPEPTLKTGVKAMTAAALDLFGSR